MNIFALLALALTYPRPGLLEALRAGLAGLSESPAREGLAAFIRKVAPLSLAEWEELATRTLDLNPAAAPYVGFQIWGESYARGEFMARLSRALDEHNIDADGELPDHLIPILRYLAATDAPFPGLIERLRVAVDRMIAILREADRDNPYLRLYEATLAAIQSQRARA